MVAGMVFKKPTDPRFVDHTSSVFYRLTVIEYAGKKGKHHYWKCLCICGNTSYPSSSDLTTGHTQSCGCLTKERTRERKTTHGKSYSHEFYIWSNMLQRCHSPNNPGYQYYGSRGVKVCERWQKFANFYADMGIKPSPKHSIDRIDNNGDYCPENCRWATDKEQGNNTRRSVWITYKGETKTMIDWARSVGIPYKTLHTRLRKLGWEIESVLTTPKLVGRGDRISSKPWKKGDQDG